MALFRKFFFRKPPDGLLEISERVFVFDCCFTTDVLEDDEYKVYMGGIVAQLRAYHTDASFMVFNFQEGEKQSQIANILSEYDMVVMDYPRQYENCPLLTMEMIHHFLRSSESWLSLGQRNVLLMHCERVSWPILAFMLAALLIYRKQYTGEQKTLDMIYKQAPSELLQLMSPLNPLPSQLRYLQYVSRRNVGSVWPPLDRALTLDCIILRFIPNMDGEGGCRPVFRIYGQDPLMTTDKTPKVLFSTPKKSKVARHFKQAECQLVKIDINCHIQGDVVLECINLYNDLECEQMIFRVMFNTAFIRSNILMLNRDDVDVLWNGKDRFPKDFRTEVIVSEMNSRSSPVTIDMPGLGEKEGLHIEAFAKAQEIFSNVDWLDPKSDLALNMLQQIASTDILQEKLDIRSLQNVKIEKLESILLKSATNKILDSGSPQITSTNVGLEKVESGSPQNVQKEKLESVFLKGAINEHLDSGSFQIASTNVLQEKLESGSPQTVKREKLESIFLRSATDEHLDFGSPQIAGDDSLLDKQSNKKDIDRLKISEDDKMNSPSLKASTDLNSKTNKIDSQEVHAAFQWHARSKILTNRIPQTCQSSPALNYSSQQNSPVSMSRYHSAPSLLGITALLHDHAESKVKETSHPVTRTVLIPPPPLPPPPPPPLPLPHYLSSSELPCSLIKQSCGTLEPIKHPGALTGPPPPAPPPPLCLEPAGTVKPAAGPPPPPPLSPPPPHHLLASESSVLTPSPLLPPLPPPPPPSPVSPPYHLSVSESTCSLIKRSCRTQEPIKHPGALINRSCRTQEPIKHPGALIGPRSPPPLCSAPAGSIKSAAGPPPPPPPPPPLPPPPHHLLVSESYVLTPPAPPPPPSPPLPPLQPPHHLSASESPCSLVEQSCGTQEPIKHPGALTGPPPSPPPPPLRSKLAGTIKSAVGPPPPPPPPPLPPHDLLASKSLSSVMKHSVGTQMPINPLGALTEPPPPPLCLKPAVTIKSAAGPPPPPPPSHDLLGSDGCGMQEPIKQQGALTGPPPPPFGSVPTGTIKSAEAPQPPPGFHLMGPMAKSSLHDPPIPPPQAPFANGLPKACSTNNGIIPLIPGPPISAKGRLNSRPSPRNQGQSSKKTSLKPYHWLKLTRAMQGSLWAESQKSDEASKAPEIDMSELENLFSANVLNSDPGTTGGKSNRLASGPKSKKVNLIDLRRAYNCEIMLTKVKIPLPDLMSSVLALDDSALDVDQVDNLIKFCPTKEEMELLKNYKGDKENLGKCEQFFLELVKVPRIEAKLRVFSFKIQFFSQVSDLRKSLNIVNSASEEVRNSVKLKRIMQTILSLGNALNHGTARGSAVGFRLDSLLKLTDTRARNNKLTLMHYLCKVLAEKLPELLDFRKDLLSLEASTRIQLKYLVEEMQAISKGLEKIVQELSASENDGPVSENFCKILKEFLGFAEAEVRSLASLYSVVGRNADALALYFGEDPARCTFEQVVSTLLNFVRMFVRAHEENCKQLEFEKKKAQKEAENEKMKSGAPRRLSEIEDMRASVPKESMKQLSQEPTNRAVYSGPHI